MDIPSTRSICFRNEVWLNDFKSIVAEYVDRLSRASVMNALRYAARETIDVYIRGYALYALRNLGEGPTWTRGIMRRKPASCSMSCDRFGEATNRVDPGRLGYNDVQSASCGSSGLAFLDLPSQIPGDPDRVLPVERPMHSGERDSKQCVLSRSGSGGAESLSDRADQSAIPPASRAEQSHRDLHQRVLAI